MQKAKKVTTFDSSVRKLANDMLETMYDEKRSRAGSATDWRFEANYGH